MKMELYNFEDFSKSELNIDSLVEILNSDNEEDFQMARTIIFDHLIVKDDMEQLRELTKKLKDTTEWNNEFRPDTGVSMLTREFKGQLYYYYRYDLGLNISSWLPLDRPVR